MAKEEKFHHTWKPLTGRDGEELQNLKKGAQQRVHGETNRVSTETSADQYSQLRSYLYTCHDKWGLGAKAPGFGGWTPWRGLVLTALKIL